MNAPPDMITGASTALLSILRARRPDLAWNVRELDTDEFTGRATPPGAVRAMLRGDDRESVEPFAFSNPDATKSAA